MIKIDDNKYEIEKVKEIDISEVKDKIENKFFEYNEHIYQIEIYINNYKIKSINNIS